MPVLFTSKTLRIAPWMLLIVAPATEVFSPIARVEDRLLVTLPFVLLLVLPVVWLLTWRPLGPIVELRDTIARLGSRPAAFAPIAVNRTDEFGDLTRDFNSLMDERLAAQAKQQKSASLLRLISDNTPALIAFLDRDLKYTFVNQRHTEWFGGAPAEFINRPLREVFGDEYFESVRHHDEAALKGQRITFDLERKLPGSTRFTHTALIPHISEAGMVTGIFKLSTDVSALKQVELALKDLARRDPLTELYNRRGLDQQLTTALQRNARNGTCLALLELDVDHFKTINDRLGHAAGDDVLQEFARRLSGCVRATDIVARIGGDEFTIVLEGLHQPAEAFEVADKILRAVEPNVITRVSKCNVIAK